MRQDIKIKQFSRRCCYRRKPVYVNVVAMFVELRHGGTVLLCRTVALSIAKNPAICNTKSVSIMFSAVYKDVLDSWIKFTPEKNNRCLAYDDRSVNGSI